MLCLAQTRQGAGPRWSALSTATWLRIFTAVPFNAIVFPANKESIRSGVREWHSSASFTSSRPAHRPNQNEYVWNACDKVKWPWVWPLFGKATRSDSVLERLWYCIIWSPTKTCAMPSHFQQYNKQRYHSVHSFHWKDFGSEMAAYTLLGNLRRSLLMWLAGITYLAFLLATSENSYFYSYSAE